jgi:hypothetical protein
MPRFLVTRTLPPLTPEQIDGASKSVMSAAQQLGNVEWIRSRVTSDGKHSFCEFEAPNADTCRQHAQIAGLPLDDVLPLGLELGPNRA